MIREERAMHAVDDFESTERPVDESRFEVVVDVKAAGPPPAFLA